MFEPIACRRFARLGDATVLPLTATELPPPPPMAEPLNKSWSEEFLLRQISAELALLRQQYWSLEAARANPEAAGLGDELVKLAAPMAGKEADRAPDDPLWVKARVAVGLAPLPRIFCAVQVSVAANEPFQN